MRALWLFGLGGLALLTGCAQAPVASRPERTVAVHGSATMPATPDRVAFTAGVETRDPSATNAFKANTRKVQTLLAALKARGVTEQQMQTSYFDIETIAARAKSPRTFRVSNLVTVTREDPTESAT